jgi:hypothetical protein
MMASHRAKKSETRYAFDDDMVGCLVDSASEKVAEHARSGCKFAVLSDGKLWTIRIRAIKLIAGDPGSSVARALSTDTQAEMDFRRLEPPWEEVPDQVDQMRRHARSQLEKLSECDPGRLDRINNEILEEIAIYRRKLKRLN